MAIVESFRSDTFEADTFDANVLATFDISEGADVAAFTTVSTTDASFAISEGADVAAFTTVSTTVATFAITEGADVAAFTTVSTTVATFAITEGADVLAFSMLTGAIFSFDVYEGADIASPAFRVWQGSFVLGDADYIVVPLENQTVLVPGGVTVISVAGEGQDANVPDEWQRIDVDQVRGRRAK